MGIRVTFCIAQKVTMVRPALTQPCATAHQPRLVAQKTRLGCSSKAWFPVLLARLFVFHVLFLDSDPLTWVLSLHETNYPRGSDSFERQSFTYSR